MSTPDGAIRGGGQLTRDQLSDTLRSLAPDEGETLYIERRGDDYAWSEGNGLEHAATLPDAWISYTGRWPAHDDEKWREFFADLIAELESMTGDADRCRWPLDDPWSHHH